MPNTVLADSVTSLAPGPKPGVMDMAKSIMGRREDVIVSYLKLWHTYGDVARVKAGPMTIHQFVRPEHIRHIMVSHVDNYPKGVSHDKLRIALGNGILTSDGPFWTRQRKLMQPTYTPKGVAVYADIMADATEKMLARWQNLPQDADPLAVNGEMMHLAMSIISRSMFGIDISDNYADAGDALLGILEYAASTSMSFIDPPLYVPTAKNRRFKQAISTIDEFLYGIIDERLQMPLGEDLLSLLISARDEEGNAMDRKQLRDEVLITFFAGHETTANLLTWTLVMLSRHPLVRERLHAELETVLNGRTPTLEDVSNLVYTRRVIDEALRLYAPVAVMGRDPLADDEIDGYHIPAGSLVTVTPYITHRHPEFWHNPEAFDPERFTPEEAAKRPRYAYYPFGAGPRICIGQHFALLEAVLALATIAQRFELQLVPGLRIEAQFVGTMRPNRDVLMMLQAR
jgi:cytochrome P450